MYCLICMDKPNHLAVRMENRSDHVAYVLGQADVKAAGPFTSENGDTMIGTLIILDVASRAEAEAFVNDDPYNKAGLFERVEIHPWQHLLGGLSDPNV